jgi:hypothetical protein
MPQQKRPHRPHSTRHSALPPSSVATRAAAVAAAMPDSESAPEALSPHPGIGVRANAESSNTPELVLVNSPGVTPVTLSNKPSARSTSAVSSHVYHPPMRTGTSSVSNKSISATAKPIGTKALKEHQ